ncbi:Protein kinase domain [Dillenia turbinata]|uniref:Protein kinase domain n=1 Tax=Dillenia turbinata TaxID=194707 RepID=A0AAN8UC07_9MAGN
MESEKRKYPIGSEYYTLYEEIGHGVSANVHRALCHPLNEIVAIKILDFERDNCDLNNISREAQTMVLVDHPNVLKSHCSFVSDHSLWVVMPYMAGGSCLHILKAAYPDGFEEVVIATILREVLKGLEYLHQHGHIHRDVKAGNILIDSRGAVKLGDFGVSACLFDAGDRQRMRNTFVGTPCWADIWSFGITALELAHGHAPFSKYPPMKRKEDDMLAQKKMPDGQKEEISQNEYKRGISGWNFDLEDLKSQASLIEDVDEPNSDTLSSFSGSDMNEKNSQFCFMQVADMEDKDSTNNHPAPLQLADSTMNSTKCVSVRSDDDANISCPSCENHTLQNSSPRKGNVIDNNLSEKQKLEMNARFMEDVVINSPQSSASSSNISQEPILLPKVGSEMLENNAQVTAGGDGAIVSDVADDVASENYSKMSKSSGTDELDEKVKGPVVQQRGRFKVTSENVELEKASGAISSAKESQHAASKIANDRLPRFEMTSLNVVLYSCFHDLYSVFVLISAYDLPVISQHPALSLPSPTDAASSANTIGPSLFPALHSVLQTNILQREGILSLMKQISTGDSTARAIDENGMAANSVVSERSLLEAAHDREKELLHEISELQWRLICAQEELQKLKTEKVQV